MFLSGYVPKGATECINCPRGFYQPATGQTECEACPNDELTEGVRAVNASQCRDAAGRPHFFLQGFVYTGRQYERYENYAMTLAILLSVAELDALGKCRVFVAKCTDLKNSMIFNENSIASIIAALPQRWY